MALVFFSLVNLAHFHGVKVVCMKFFVCKQTLLRATRSEAERAHCPELLSIVLCDFKQRDVSETIAFSYKAYCPKKNSL